LMLYNCFLPIISGPIYLFILSRLWGRRSPTC
jgi:hypothetical protein